MLPPPNPAGAAWLSWHCRGEQSNAENFFTVVEVNPSSRHVEEDVAFDEVLARLGLEPRRRLLLEVAELVDEILRRDRAAWLLAIRSVDAGLVLRQDVVVRRAAERGGVAPRGDDAVTDPHELVPRDGGVPVVAGQHDGVAVDPRHEALRDRHALRPLQVDRTHPLQAPVSPRGHAVRLHVPAERNQRSEMNPWCPQSFSSGDMRTCMRSLGR